MSFNIFNWDLENFDLFPDFDHHLSEVHSQDIFHNGLHIEDQNMYEGYTGNLVGDPGFDATHFHHQSYDNTCAIVAQQGILESHGIFASEHELMRIAAEHGWFSTDGTVMHDMGKLLEHFGIQVEYNSNASIHDLVNELSHGDKVIVGLDASEIWTPQHNGDLLNWYAAELPDKGHAVWVTGVDLEHGVVYMNDSGIADGAARPVAINDFMNAWEDFGNNYCTTA